MMKSYSHVSLSSKHFRHLADGETEVPEPCVDNF